MEWQTHLVFNQPEPLSNSNLFLSDTALREAVMREHAGWDGEDLSRIGLQLGSQESLELGGWRTPILQSYYVTMLQGSAWTKCAFIPPGMC